MLQIILYLHVIYCKFLFLQGVTKPLVQKLKSCVSIVQCTAFREHFKQNHQLLKHILFWWPAIMRDALGWVFSNDCCWLKTIWWTPPPLELSGSSGSLEAGIRNALGRSKRARGDTLSFVSQIFSSMVWPNNWRRTSLVTVAVWLHKKKYKKYIYICIYILKIILNNFKNAAL